MHISGNGWAGGLPHNLDRRAHRHSVAKWAAAVLLSVSLLTSQACTRHIRLDPGLVRAVEENRVDDAVRMIRAGANHYEGIYRRGFVSCRAGILGVAAKNNLSEMVRRLIEAGVEPNPPVVRGKTCVSALSQAAEAGHLEMVKQLLDAGAHPNWELVAPMASIMGKSEAALKKLGLDTDSWEPVSLPGLSGFENPTPLALAAYGDHVEVMKVLLDAGAYKWDALDYASAAGNLASMKLLLDAGMDPNLLEFPGSWNYPLAQAAKAGKTEAIQMLLDAGADVEGPESVALTPLMRAAEGGHIEAAQTLLDAGANINTAKNVGSALNAAVRANQVGMAELLINSGAELEFTDTHGLTPLILAASGNHHEIVELLVKAGASIRPTTEHGSTALMHMAIYGRNDAVRMLIEAGAEIDAENKFGNTALILAVRHGHVSVVRHLVSTGVVSNRILDHKDKKGISALHRAAGQGRLDLVKLLIEAGADVNLPSQAYPVPEWLRFPPSPGLHDGATPLIFATSAFNHKERVTQYRTLTVEGGAYFRLLDKDGMLPPKYLEKYRAYEPSLSPDPRRRLARVEIVRQLIAAGADVNATDDAHGITALFGAASMGRLEIVRLLLETGADPSVVNKYGMTALHMAQKARHPDIAEIIAAAANNL